MREKDAAKVDLGLEQKSRPDEGRLPEKYLFRP